MNPDEAGGITILVIDDLLAQVTDVPLTLIGHFGCLYPNLPELNLNTAEAGEIVDLGSTIRIRRAICDPSVRSP